MTSKTQSVTTLSKRTPGTWRMLAWTRRLVASGEESDALGSNPFGYINTHQTAA